MLDNKENDIGTEKLDHLLDESFLNLDFDKPENEFIMQAISNEVMGTDRYAIIRRGSVSRLPLIKRIILFTLPVICAVCLLYYWFNEKSGPASISLSPAVPRKVDMESLSRKEISETVLPLASKNESRKKVSPVEQDSKQRVVPITVGEQSVNEVSEKLTPVIPVGEEVIKDDSAYVFPKLTEKEIKDNHKQKRKMIEQLAKFNKRQYASIPMGTFTYKGKTTSLFPFYMQNTEVTNLEYRTFLYDLLIQDRKDEFLKAKPDQKQWIRETKSDCFKLMVETYFSDHVYDNHPVVNISREGAQMYCAWLTTETNKWLAEKGKDPINDVRLPYEEEWIYAAEGGNDNADYPWKINSISTAKGCFMANFSYQKFLNSADTTMHDCNQGKNMEAFSTGGHSLDGKQITVWVSSYNPNDYGIYCMGGNVAEMVQLKDGDVVKPGTKGGSWNSDADHVRIHASDEYAGKTAASPYIGFRPVISKKPFRVKMDAK